MIDLSWYTIPTGGFLILFGVMWYFLFVKSLFYEQKIDKNLNPQKISVLTACRNEENVIGNIINDVLNQTYQNWELLICVNNTTDNTYEKALESGKGDKRIKVFKYNPKEIGKAPALNYLLDKVKGDVVLVFDTDNRIKKNFLEILNEYFMDSKVNAVQSAIGATNGKKNFLTKMQDMEFIIFSRLFAKGRKGYGTGISGTGFAIRKNILKELDGWKNELVEDLDLFIRLQQKNIKVIFAEEIITYDEKPENWDDLIKQRKRWIKGHLTIFFKNLRYLLSQNPLRTKFWLDFAYLASPLSVVFMLSHLMLFYFMIFGGFRYVTYFYFPLSLWIVSLVLYGVILTTILVKEEKSYIKYIPFYIFIFTYHWMIVFF